MKAVVTVSRGSVRTVRAPSKFRRLRVGQRAAVTARTRPDGTYAAATVRGQGRVSGFASVESSFGMTDVHGA